MKFRILVRNFYVYYNKIFKIFINIVIILGINLKINTASSAALSTEDNSIEPSSYGEEGVNSIKKLFKLYGWLPTQTVDGINTYLKLISGVHGGANESIEKSNWNATNQYPHFAYLAAKYYLWLIENDLNQVVDRAQRQQDIYSRPKILDSTKVLGLIWKKAVEISNGDTHLAVRLIGLFGHDDAISLKPSLPKNHFFYKKYILNRYLIINKAILKLEKLLDKNTVDVFREFRDAQSGSMTVFNTSTLFYPKSLGSEVDISQSLK
jgi:hypothetical protein